MVVAITVLVAIAPGRVGTKISIVEEASEMGDQAYDPNPVKVKVGDTITWTNDDSQAHTVTSGTDSSDSNKEKALDSSPGLATLLSTNLLT